MVGAWVFGCQQTQSGGSFLRMEVGSVVTETGRAVRVPRR